MRDSPQLGLELVDERGVFLHRVVLREPFPGRPGVELRAALEVEHPRPRTGDVPLRGLLVERVEAEELVVGRALGELLDARLRLVELVCDGRALFRGHAISPLRAAIIRNLAVGRAGRVRSAGGDRKSTRLNSS